MSTSTTVLPPAAFGVAGNTSADMLDRVAQLGIDDTVGVTRTPDVAVIYGFPNDPVNSLSQATTQANCEALIMAAKFEAYGDGVTPAGAYVAGQANLPSMGRVGQRQVVQTDTSTTGGAVAVDGSQTARLSGDFSSSSRVAVWECRASGLAGEMGWGRIADHSTTPDRCKRIIVVSTNYKNYGTDGGGSGTTASAGKRDLTGTPETYYAAVRTAQQAAVTAQNVAIGGKASVVYADLYTLQRTMIVGGTFPASGSPTLSRTFAAGFVPDFSGGASYDATKDWHYAANNQHHNRFGHWCVALAVHLAIVNAGWATALADLTVVNVKAIGDSQTSYTAGYCRAFFTWAPVLGRMLQDYLRAL